MARYQPGDIVLRRKGVVMHKGIVLNDGRVFHNTPFAGEHVSSADEFRSGHRLYVERLTPTERRRALRTAASDNPQRYHLLTNNCEHTVSRARSGEASSQQLEAWAVGVGLGALAFALTRRPSLAVAGFALGASVAPRALKWARQVRRTERE